MDKYIQLNLQKYFPDKIVTNLYSTNLSLYQLVAKTARERGLNISQYLEMLGFEYILLPRGRQSNFDSVTANLLLKDYDVTQSELAKWLNITQQAVSSNLKRKSNGISWVSNQITSEEEAIILYMVENKLFTLYEDDLIVAIRTNYEMPCIIFVYNNEPKVVFEMSNTLINVLVNNNYHRFREIDFQFKEELVPVFVFGEKYAKPKQSDTRKRIIQYCRKRKIGLDDYFSLLGFKGCVDSRVMTDEEIIEIIEKYVIKDNVVFFPHTAEHYFQLVSRASRAKMTIDQFFEFFGYIKVDSRLESSYRNKIEEYKKDLEEYLVEGTSNKLILKSDSSIYRRLYPFAKRRGITVDEFLKEIGFERVFDKNASVKFDSFVRNGVTAGI